MALKAHGALSMDDLGPLMVKSSSEVMLSHIQKLVQVSTVGHFYFFFSFAFFLLREVFFAGFKGVFVRLWEVLGLGKEGGFV